MKDCYSSLQTSDSYRATLPSYISTKKASHKTRNIHKELSVSC